MGVLGGLALGTTLSRPGNSGGLLGLLGGAELFLSDRLLNSAVRLI